MGYRLIEVEELADHGLIIDVFGYGAEAVILRHGGEIVLAVILPKRLVVPHDAFLHIAAVQTGLVHQLVEGCTNSNKLFLCDVLLFHKHFILV